MSSLNNKYNRRHRKFCTRCRRPDYEVWGHHAPDPKWGNVMREYNRLPYCPSCYGVVIAEDRARQEAQSNLAAMLFG